MADNTQIKWIYPPNWEGTWDSHIKNGPKKYVVQCTCASDGTGEDEVMKVKRTDLLSPSGGIPSKLVVEKIEYDISGMEVLISYNNDNDEEVVRLYDSQGCKEFNGGFTPADDATNEGGDIIFTTSQATSGDSYDITLTIRPKD